MQEEKILVSDSSILPNDGSSALQPLGIPEGFGISLRDAKYMFGDTPENSEGHGGKARGDVPKRIEGPFGATATNLGQQ